LKVGLFGVFKIAYNVPVIKLVGVTWRRTGHRSRYFRQKFVTVQERYGASFAVQVQSWISITRVAVQRWCKRYISHGAEILCVAAAWSGFIPQYKAVLRAGV